MKKIIGWVIRIVLLLGLVLGGVKVGFIIKGLFADLISPSEIKLETKGICSDFHLNVIKEVFNDMVSSDGIKRFNPGIYYGRISKKVDLVSKIRWMIDASKKGILEVIGVNPSFILGGDRVIAENRKIYPNEYFEQYDFSSLRKIAISSSYSCQEITDNFYQFLQKIPPELWNRYTITYEGPSLIRLKDLIKGWEVVVDENNIFDRGKLEQLEFVSDEINSKKLFVRRCQNGARLLIFDLRFDRRILVRLQNN